jgi:hypothetical protein
VPNSVVIPEEPQWSADKIVEMATQERGQVEKTLGGIELDRLLKELNSFKQVRDSVLGQASAQKDALSPAADLLVMYVFSSSFLFVFFCAFPSDHK